MAMLNEIFEDNLQAAKSAGLTPRYDLISKSGAKAEQFIVEQPKEIVRTFQALGKGNNVDMIV